MSHSPSGTSLSDPDLMSVLEERLNALVERHREALKVIEELRGQLEHERGAAAVLARQLRRRDSERAELRDKVEVLIDRLMRIEAALEEQAEDRDGGD